MARTIGGRITLVGLVVVALAVSISCITLPGGRGGAMVTFDTPLDFGDQIRVQLVPSVPQTASARVQTPGLPTQRPASVAATLDKSAVRLTKDISTTGRRLQAMPDRVDIEFLAAAATDTDPCATGTPFGSFRIEGNLNDDPDGFAVTSTGGEIPCSVIEQIFSGELQVCMRATANFGGSLQVLELSLDLNTAGDSIRVIINLASSLGVLNVQSGVTTTNNGSASFQPTCAPPARTAIEFDSARVSGSPDLTGTNTVDLMVHLAAADGDACAAEAIGPFTITLVNGAGASIEPPRIDLSPAALNSVISGDFSLCLEATADFTGTLTIEELIIILQF